MGPCSYIELRVWRCRTNRRTHHSDMPRTSGTYRNTWTDGFGCRHTMLAEYHHYQHLKMWIPPKRKKEQQNLDIMVINCVLHRETLVARTVGSEVKSVLDMVVKIANYMTMRPLKCRQFAKLCESMEADHVILVQQTDVRWLSRGIVLRRFYETRREMLAFL